MICKTRLEIPNLASDLRRSATNDIQQKGVINNVLILLGYSNPAAIKGNIVVQSVNNHYTVHSCGNLVFSMIQGVVYLYHGGNWTNTLANEVSKILIHNSVNRYRNLCQLQDNEIAKRNYIV